VFLSVDLANRSVDPDPYVPEPLPRTETDGGRHG
jgi:citrate synthase